jgi:hypothetical protein
MSGTRAGSGMLCLHSVYRLPGLEILLPHGRVDRTVEIRLKSPSGYYRTGSRRWYSFELAFQRYRRERGAGDGGIKFNPGLTSLIFWWDCRCGSLYTAWLANRILEIAQTTFGF